MPPSLSTVQRSPRRVTITVSHHIAERLTTRADDEGRSVSNLAAFLLELALDYPRAT